MTRGPDVKEARIVRCRGVGIRRRWRWDVTRFAQVEGRHPGVFDARLHLIGDFGYTSTWLAAAVNVVRRVTS
ncbi:hypothetical protein [Micromonospora aurantiaca (nom. illeg.)]|uniref:hypothetical protein n=1 Tax=Micromonospora aurantiaca (nom. illeg.) TaxID=47850 RepID=UPI0033FA5BC9